MKSFIFCFLWVVFPVSLYSQLDSSLTRLNSFVKNVQVFNQLYPQEKVYLHFDNTGYFLGETIWFKAYVTVASTLQATSLSRVLYVELINEDGYIMDSRKYLIENGQAHGDLPLTKVGMKSGFYEVRAYTRLMLNWEKEFLFSRVFPVFESPVQEGLYSKKRIRRRPVSQSIPVKREEFRPESGTKKVNASFYPEGGGLVEGLSSLVAFKVTDDQGRSLSATGEVCDASGDTLCSFSTFDRGMGSFVYTPQAGVRSEVCIHSEGKRYTFSLPEASSSGVALSVNALHPEYVQIRVSRRLEDASLPKLGLLCSCRGLVLAFKEIDFSSVEGDYLLRIPRRDLPSGVNQITLFDSSGRIYGERLLFAHSGNRLHISSRQDKASYGALDPVRLDFSCTTDSGVPVSTVFSLSVRDASTAISSASYGDIRSNLLLSSDLKGHIEDVDSYFESDDRAHRLSLDLLMLTQGWRRYRMDQMMGLVPFEAKHKIEKGIVIDGSVNTVARKKGAEGVDVNMWLYSLEDGNFQKGSCPTDSSGGFNFLAEDFFGKNELQLETKQKNKRKEFWITLDRHFAPLGRGYSYWDTYLPQSREDVKKNTLWVEDGTSESDSLELLRLSKGANLLKNVTVREKGNWNLGLVEKSSIMYDVTEEEERMTDDMSGYNETLLDFLSRTNPNFEYGEYDPETETWKLPCYRSPEYVDPVYCTYKGKAALFVVDGKRIDATGYYNRTILASDIEKIYILETQSDFMKYYFALKGQGIDNFRGDMKSQEKEDQIRDNEERARIISAEGGETRSKDLSSLPNVYPINIPSYDRSFVAIYLQTYKQGSKHLDPLGIRKTYVMGYSVSREFYNPNYKEYALPHEGDYRRTLYWNPNVGTNSQGKASVNFYNNSVCENMEISAETITRDGVLGSYSYE